MLQTKCATGLRMASVNVCSVTFGWSLAGKITEARPVTDPTQTQNVGLAWPRGTARPSLVDPFLGVAWEQPHPRHGHRFSRKLRSVLRICRRLDVALGSGSI